MYIQKNRKQDLKEISVHPFSQRHYAQRLKYGSNTSCVGPSKDEWMSEGGAHTTEHRSASRRRGTATGHATDEPRGHRAPCNKPVTKRHTVWFHSCEPVRVVKIIETENTVVVARSSGDPLLRRGERGVIIVQWAWRFRFARREVLSGRLVLTAAHVRACLTPLSCAATGDGAANFTLSEKIYTVHCI